MLKSTYLTLAFRHDLLVDTPLQWMQGIYENSHSPTYDPKPLRDLLRDNSVFHFGPEQQLAFQTLRQKLSENPVLHTFKQGAKLELYIDASKFGYGAILLQQSDNSKLHPVRYFSKKTTLQEEKYSSYEL
ncbi:transposon Tf2-9 polyprotein [Trichonephila clavipes]|nr:transposon Tf2-9 polyprotein [Trichonephila clavipes]